jgi:hypothetical protein
MTQPTFTAATARFAGWKPEWGVPVRTTVGHPRFFRHPLENVPELAPFGIMRNPLYDTKLKFMLKYMERLDANGLTIIRKCNDIAAAHGGERLVFLCFEDVHKPGEWCHRTMIATWFEDRLGMILPELTGKPAPTAEQGAFDV